MGAAKGGAMLTAILVVEVLAAVGILATLLMLALVMKAGAREQEGPTLEQIRELERDESDRTRKAFEEESRGQRQELNLTINALRESTQTSFKNLSDTLTGQIASFGTRLNEGLSAIDQKAETMRGQVEGQINQMGLEATQSRDALRLGIDGKLAEAELKRGQEGKILREEITGSFTRLSATVSQQLDKAATEQKDRLGDFSKAISTLSEKQEKAAGELKLTVEGRLDVLRNENAEKLDQMRQTVDEKLQSTLETRLGESFTRVVEHLERVHKGIGEMQSLAAGVGDLKKVLSNVRVRGTFGEVQLALLLEQFLSPEQFIKNAAIKEHSQERVEFAIRLPGKNDGIDVLLPVDAKFPQEEYARLVDAAEQGDVEAVNEAARKLEVGIKGCAKTISDKYLSPPRTTDFAILFLPTESLYAEVLRRPGLFEQLQRDYHVTLTGPATFTALLNALQMGFRSLAIEKRSSEVWEILGAVQNEFGKYNTVVDKLSKQLNSAANSVSELGTRTRAMSRQLRNVEKIPAEKVAALIGLDVGHIQSPEIADILNDESSDRP